MISAERIEQRLVSLRTELAAGGLDGAVIVQNTDLAYFTGTNQQAHLIVPGRGRAAAAGAAHAGAGAGRSRRWLGSSRCGRSRGWRRHWPMRASSRGARIGFELDVLRATTYLGYVRRLDGYRIEDASSAIAAVRSRKSPQDIADMRVAAAQVDQATRAVPEPAAARVGPNLRFK